MIIVPGKLNLALMQSICESTDDLDVALDPQCLPAIADAAGTVARVVSNGKTIYGINTGFGQLANTRIDRSDLRELQRNLILSHTAGLGAPLEDRIVRLAILLKVNSLARGYSGVRPVVIDYLLRFLNGGAIPEIPCKGSVGASGDLAPLAHLAGALLGNGRVAMGGQSMAASEALTAMQLEPLQLEPKEGLALLNGTQISTAVALVALFDLRRVFSAAVVAGAMSVDAAMGSDAPFDPRIHQLRPHRGQSQCARWYRELLADSEIRRSHVDCTRVQDPYSLRCQPQVMGACLDQMAFAETTLEIEANAVSDNPLVFSDDDDVVSGGNFHAEPVAMAADNLALATAEIGALSERRIALLIDQHLSNLPPFLVRQSGLHSGFMIPQVAATALASENKLLAHPASVDSLPTSANQEDHVSMATFAARRLHEMVDNSCGIVAVELLAAAQGIDLRQPLVTSPALQSAHNLIRERVAFYERDRPFDTDIQHIKKLVLCGQLEPECLLDSVVRS